jgi:hypothetical protein
VSHRLFLRWAWLNGAAACGFAGLGLGGFASGAHSAPLVALAVILTITAAVSGYAGRLYWRADYLEETADPGRAAAGIVHDAKHVYEAVAVCQILGLVGAMLGYREITSSAALPNGAEAVRQLTLGLGNGLTATLAGVLCSLVLWLEAHALVHRLERE